MKKENNGLLCLVYFLFINCSVCMAQGIKVAKVEEAVSGTDAFHAPTGSNGAPCGLVKVKSTIQDLSFAGKIMGNVENRMNEYLVYMEKGSTQLLINRPNILPFVINFPDYGIESLASKATYNVLIKDFKINPKTNTVYIDVKPSFARITIDNIPISTETNGNGHYQMILPKGGHVCRFEADGYSTIVKGINVGKDNPNLVVELESQLSDLDISCQTPSASIYINDTLKGVGSWKGRLPSGSYSIEARMDGYIHQSQNIKLGSKENKAIVIPKLKRKRTKLMIETSPIKFTSASIDGFDVAKFPYEVEVGEHSLLLQAYGCDTIRCNINIFEGKDNQFVFLFSTKNKYYESAYNGDMEIMMALADNKLGFGKTDEDIQEGKFWLSMILSNSGNLTTSFLSQNFLQKSSRPEDYEQRNEMERAIGPFCNGSYYKKYKVLFYLFTKANDYKNACWIIKKCGNLQNNFDGIFCSLIGDAYLKLNQENEAVKWYRRCIESDTYDNVKENARKIIEKIEKKK